MTGAVVAGIGRLLDVSGHWMAWNLVLALVPWMLSLYLFRPTRRPGAAWVCGALCPLPSGGSPPAIQALHAARGWARSPWAVELPVHALSALAIY